MFIISETEWILFLSYVTEVVFIVLVNAFTLATFATNHQLRKRSTYLIINLTVADLLFGTTEGLLSILEPAILERYLPCSTKEWFSWHELVLLTLYFLFPVASLVYILFILFIFGAFPYIFYIGMCRPKRSGFCNLFGLKNWYRLYLLSSGIVYSFRGSYIWECINAFVVSIPNE